MRAGVRVTCACACVGGWVDKGALLSFFSLPPSIGPQDQAVACITTFMTTCMCCCVAPSALGSFLRLLLQGCTQLAPCAPSIPMAASYMRARARCCLMGQVRTHTPNQPSIMMLWDTVVLCHRNPRFALRPASAALRMPSPTAAAARCVVMRRVCIACEQPQRTQHMALVFF